MRKYAIIHHHNYQGMGEWFETHVHIVDTQDEEEALKALEKFKDDYMEIYKEYGEGCVNEGEKFDIIVRPIPQHEEGYAYHVECFDIWSNLTLATLDE